MKQLLRNIKRMNKIELYWTESCTYNVDKEGVFQALVNLYNDYAPEFDESYDYVETVVEWLNDNLESYIEEFIKELDPLRDINGDIDNETITDLLDNEGFMNEFEEWLNE